MSIAIKIENLSKQYRLGLVSTRTLSHDLNRWWQTSILGREDPYLKIGETNIRESKGTSEYVWALKDINLEVEEGEVLGVIGKNGAGKSTLLKILSKVTAPTTGVVKARGRIASLLEVGTGFHQEMTGRENIYMNGAIMGMTKSEIRKKFDEIVDFAGVERYIDTPVKRYSSGMTVRLGFAVAAHLEPEILIVDEVLAVGDAEFQKKAVGKMKEVSEKEGRTVLFVSHNMAAVRQLCSKSILLEKGFVHKIGLTEEIINLYQYSSIDTPNPLITGNGKAKVLDFTIENSDFKKIDTFNTFDEIHFNLRYQIQCELKNVTFAVCLNNELGQRVTSIWSSYINQKFNLGPGEFVLRINVPSIHLIPGIYEIVLYVESNGEVFERIDNFRNIIVGYSNSFGLVKVPKLEQGIYIETFN